ncbi:MAG: glycosyltransferase [Anaerolineae bacterium]|jgi:UDP:flavonoid glycosyltransferase YjiC (YdhE family)
MHVTLLTYGSRGDVEPFVALGRGLLQAGHSVRLAAPQPFESFVTAHDIDFVGFPGDPNRLVQDLVDEAGENWWRMTSVMSKFVVPLAVRVFEKARSACDGADIIIHSFLFTAAGHQVAQDLEVPDVSAQFFPIFASTAEFPGVVFPDLPLGDFYRRLSHWVISQTFWQGGRVLYGWVRRSNPGLPPLTPWPFGPHYERRPPLMYAFSPAVVPQPADWPGDAQVTGYWFLDDPGEWQPPTEIVDFLETGPAPVSISFGSTSTRNRGKLAEAVAGALAANGLRGLLVGAGWDSTDCPGSILALESAPYGWLFPRMAAVVHHGGAGTTGAGLRAGVPNIVVPFTSDQPFWGRRVYELGAGPKPIPARRLSAQRLADALVEATSSGKMRASAEEVGRRIRAEDGVSRAIEAIEAHLEAGA